MGAMVVRRPLLSLYLSPDSSLAPSGELLPFWSRFVVSFTRTAGELQHVVALTIADDPAAALDVPAQGFVVAETSGDSGVGPNDIAFGQLLFAPQRDAADPGRGGDRVDAQASGALAAPSSSRVVVDFHHDAAAIARDAVAELAASAVREVLVVRRPGDHDYVDRITAHLPAAAAEHGILLTQASGAKGFGMAAGDAADVLVAPEQVAAWLDGRSGAGVLVFGQAPAVRAGVAAAECVVTAQATEGGVVLMVMGEVPMVQTDATVYVSLQGAQAGRIVAESVVRALATGEAIVVVLPHAVIRWDAAQQSIGP